MGYLVRAINGYQGREMLQLLLHVLHKLHIFRRIIWRVARLVPPNRHFRSAGSSVKATAVQFVHVVAMK
ncbi:MAG: hypothetical protein H0X30_16170 [Anaerolineae bacterium]|nr:hypothetical protein [Anaerolineae bacterium]